MTTTVLTKFAPTALAAAAIGLGALMTVGAPSAHASGKSDCESKGGTYSETTIVDNTTGKIGTVHRCCVKDATTNTTSCTSTTVTNNSRIPGDRSPGGDRGRRNYRAGSADATRSPRCVEHGRAYPGGPVAQQTRRKETTSDDELNDRRLRRVAAPGRRGPQREVRRRPCSFSPQPWGRDEEGGADGGRGSKHPVVAVWNVLELSLALGVKPALGAILALDGDPLTKPVIINRVGRWHHRAGQLSTTWPSRTWTLIHCRSVRHQGSSIRFAAAGRNHLGRQTQP